jgi:maleylacetate reductase
VTNAVFSYITHEVRVVFGAGSIASLPDELDREGMTRLMLLTTPSRPAERQRIAGMLGDRVAGEYAGARLHVPVDVVLEARTALDRIGPETLVAVGGGSAIGLGKALAYETRLPLVAIPTTYSGSEMTAIWGKADQHGKKTFRDTVVAPRLVIYDPDLTLGLPADVSSASGMNAIAHCIEAEYAPERNPVVSWFAMEGLRRLAANLPAIAASPGNARARSEALLGAHFAGRALDMTSMGLEHKLAHVLGGNFQLNHAEAHAALVPWVLAWNAEAVPDSISNMSKCLGVTDPAESLAALSKSIGVRTLHQLGFNSECIPRAVELVLAMSFPNPRPVDAEGVTWVLERAIRGSR